MPSLEHRVAKLEAELLKVRFDDLSDDELRAYSRAQPFRSPEEWRSALASVLRHPSAFPVVSDEQARAVLDADKLANGDSLTLGSPHIQ